MTSQESRINSFDITAVVLCGGQGSRLNGQDKPLISLNGARLIDLLCERLIPQVNEIVISCSRNVGIYEALPYRLAVDDEFNLGPLAGLTKAFELVETKWVFTTPGDTPFLPRNIIELLAGDALSQGVAVPEVEGVTQNLCLLINRERREQLTHFHTNGGNAVKHWLHGESIRSTLMRELEDSFLNINTVEDLERARQILTTSTSDE